LTPSWLSQGPPSSSALLSRILLLGDSRLISSSSLPSLTGLRSLRSSSLRPLVASSSSLLLPLAWASFSLSSPAARGSTVLTTSITFSRPRMNLSTLL